MAVTKGNFPITNPSQYACGIDNGIFSSVLPKVESYIMIAFMMHLLLPGLRLCLVSGISGQAGWA